MACGRTPRDKRIDEVNAAIAKAEKLRGEAEQKRTEARQKSESGDEAGYDRLIEEAANLYGQVADTLNAAATKTDEMAKLKQPEWYEEYFGLQSKLNRNLAQMATGAHDELLIKKNGPPSESQVQSWRENISRINKENDELSQRIKTIEKREGLVLRKE